VPSTPNEHWAQMIFTSVGYNLRKCQPPRNAYDVLTPAEKPDYITEVAYRKTALHNGTQPATGCPSIHE
jgi:hypothetical protein